MYEKIMYVDEQIILRDNLPEELQHNCISEIYMLE